MMNVARVVKVMIIIGYVVLAFIAYNKTDPGFLPELRTQPESVCPSEQGTRPPLGDAGATMSLKRQEAIRAARKRGEDTYKFEILMPPPPIAGAGR